MQIGRRCFGREAARSLDLSTPGRMAWSFLEFCDSVLTDVYAHLHEKDREYFREDFARKGSD